MMTDLKRENPGDRQVLTVCDSCSSTDYVDTPVHDGRSLRRDCAKCGHCWGFPIWHGVQLVNSTTPGTTNMNTNMTVDTPNKDTKMNENVISIGTTAPASSPALNQFTKPAGLNTAILKKSKPKAGGRTQSGRDTAPPNYKKKALAALDHLRRLFGQLELHAQAERHFEEIEKGIKNAKDTAVSEPL